MSACKKAHGDEGLFRGLIFLKGGESMEAGRLIKVREYANYTGVAIGTAYNQVSEFFRSGSTQGLFIKPVRVGKRAGGIRFDKQRLDKVLDELS